MFFSILILIFSVVIMRRCSSSFDIAANYLTRELGEGVKGPTINAIASSLPELLISSMFLFYYKNITGFSAGYATIIGSSAFNIALIPVIAFAYLYFNKDSSIKKDFQINKSIVKQDTLFLLGSIVILSSVFYIGISVYLGCLLISFYVLYIYIVIKFRIGDKKLEKNALMTKFIKENNLKLNQNIIFTEQESFLKSLYKLNLFRVFFSGKVNSLTSSLVVFLSVIIIGSSCYFLVLATEHISNNLGLNLFFGAFIIAAIASSIPDTIFSVKDASKGKFVDSFSNAYGSNIFDICIGLGLPVLVYASIYGKISISFPIERMGWVGDYIFSGNLFLWSLLILFSFTLIISFIYYMVGLNFKSALTILFLYIIFIILLIIF